MPAATFLELLIRNEIQRQRHRIVSLPVTRHDAEGHTDPVIKSRQEQKSSEKALEEVMKDNEMNRKDWQKLHNEETRHHVAIEEDATEVILDILKTFRETYQKTKTRMSCGRQDTGIPGQ